VPTARPLGDPSGIYEVTWGVRDPSCLAAIRAELSVDRSAVIDNDGVLRSTDDLGLRLAFRVTARVAIAYSTTAYNAPGQPNRVNRRGPHYERASPHEISHLAIAVDDAGDAARFYIDRLGFHVSDRYANRGMFMRCSPTGNHHHLFLLNGIAPGARFGHLAFKVRDAHEVIAGGQAFDAKGWTTFAGPGRHTSGTSVRRSAARGSMPPTKTW
jgi:catechol 2,3-dioxygenase-like lactoylglutathione lyase family enzyme